MEYLTDEFIDYLECQKKRMSSLYNSCMSYREKVELLYNYIKLNLINHDEVDTLSSEYKENVELFYKYAFFLFQEEDWEDLIIFTTNLLSKCLELKDEGISDYGILNKLLEYSFYDLSNEGFI